MLSITLKDTLADFFAAEQRLNPQSPARVFISYNPISDVDFSDSLPRNTKYLIQQWRAASDADFSSIINVTLMPQRMAWMAGKMPVFFLKDEEDIKPDGATHFYDSVEDDLTKTIKVLDSRSRFEPKLHASYEKLRASVGHLSVIPYLPCDGLISLVHHIDPDVHYKLLSKRGLALSGLCTPSAQVVDFGLPQASWNSETIHSEVARAIRAIHERTLPFVVKSNSSGGSKGVYIVRTSAERATVEKDIARILPSELRQINAENAHLYPCTLVLTDFLAGNTVGLNFYVGSNGQAQFSSLCEQDFAESGHWLGGTIVYSQQARLASIYSQTMAQAAAFLHSEGYQGPVGVDVMTDERGRHNVIDLNPRPTGTFVLGCLSLHFADKLGMDEASVLPFMDFLDSRDAFESAFEKELRVGQIIVIAWYTHPKTLRSYMCLVIGAKDKFSRQLLHKCIEAWVLKRQS